MCHIVYITIKFKLPQPKKFLARPHDQNRLTELQGR